MGNLYGICTQIYDTDRGETTMFKNLLDRFGQSVGIGKQEEEQETFFFTDTLPSTFQTTSDTVQNLTELAASQRLFLTDHANDLRIREGELNKLRAKLEEDGPRSNASLNSGSWTLHDITLSDNDAVDVIRSSPDAMSDLQFQLFTKAPAGFLASFRKFFSFSSQIDVRESSIATEIGFSLSVAEVVEAYVSTFKTVAATLANPPKRSEEAFVSRLYELKSSHRGRENSVYLLVEVELTNRTMSRDREAMALNVATELNIYSSEIFGPDLPVVSMIEDDPSGLAVSGMSRAELIDVFSEEATFLAKSNVDVVVDAETGSGAATESKRASKVAFHATKRLFNAANTASSQFSRKVHEQRKRDVEEEWEAEKAEIAAEKAKAEAEAAEAAFQQQKQQPRGDFGGYDDEYDDGMTLPELEARNFLGQI